MIEETPGAFVHGRCYIEEHGLAALLCLQEHQVAGLTLDDIGQAAMQAVLDKFYPIPKTVD
jgi:hypothetical protein